MSGATILVVDDEKNQRELLANFLRDLGYTVHAAAGRAEAFRVLERERVDLVLSDYTLGDGTGADILEHVRRTNPLVQFILFTAFGSVKRAVDFMKQGAADYLAKPLDLDELEVKVRKIVQQKTILEENKALRENLERRQEFANIIFQSRAMEEVVNVALRAAQSTATVLIIAESGTGKELLARAIHFASPRADGKFVAVNCSALNDHILESELFGHEKGAFTGADRRRLGRFEEAAGGTLFLDEIGEIPASLQVKLLRVLQEKTIQRLGSNENIPVDFRLIAATNRDLPELARRGEFRSDLFYRLNVIRLEIPPLRRRKEDIPGLIDHFIHTFAAANARPVDGVSPEAMHLLMRHDFPGNVRELENMVERAVVLARTSRLQPEDFPELTGAGGASLTDELFHLPLPQAVAALERHRISEALEAAGHVQIRAAEALGMTERNLRYKMEKYGIAARRK